MSSVEDVAAHLPRYLGDGISKISMPDVLAAATANAAASSSSATAAAPLEGSAAATVALASALAFTGSYAFLRYRHWRSAQWRATCGQGGLEVPTTPPQIPKWVDDADAFHVLVSMCDALIPSFASKTFSRDDVAKELRVSMGAVSSQKFKTNKEIEALFPFVFESLEKKSVVENHLQRGALDANLPYLVATAIDSYALPKDKTDLFIALKALSSTVGCLALTGYAIPFQHLSLELRVKTLLGLRDSSFVLKRAIYHSFKRLTGFFFLAYSTADANAAPFNPSWEALKYDPSKSKATAAATATSTGESPSSPSPPRVLCSLKPDSSNEIQCDVVIVGSGAGGGMMAYQLAKAGYQVVVVEKGAFYTKEDYAAPSWTEAEAMKSLYERGGLASTADGNIVVLAGATVGGGTTVNWSASFRTPTHVLEDWSRAVGGDQFTPGGEFEKCLDEVHSLLGVNTDFSHREGPMEGTGIDSPNSFVVNLNNRALYQAASKCGYSPQKIARNVKGCKDCGSCTFGCSHGAKVSTWQLMESLLNRPQTTGRRERCLHILSDCSAERILFADESRRDSAIGVACKMLKTQQSITIRAAVTVVSAGALHTPALLLRSKLSHPKIGKHLCLHPVLGVVGIANDLLGEESTGMCRGVGMGVVVGRATPSEQKLMGMDKTRRRKDVSDHGIAIQTPPIHPGLIGIAMPWNSGLGFKLNALLYPNVLAYIGISRDRSCESNCITIDAHGNMAINYTLTADDQPMVLQGLEAQLNVMRKSGVDILFPMTEAFPWYVRDKKASEEENDAAFDNYVKQVRSQGYSPLKNLCFSAHQMGSCRMSSNKREGAVQPTGETYEVKDLFVADSSLFPTSLGINPMITIEALSIMVSKNIIKRLQDKNVAIIHQDYEMDAW